MRPSCLSHLTGIVAHTTPLRAGQASVVMRRFDLEQFLANIQKFEINEFGIVPPILIAILMSPLTPKYSLKTIRSVSVGAAPLGKDTQERFRKLVPKEATVNQVWGMTESECHARRLGAFGANGVLLMHHC